MCGLLITSKLLLSVIPAMWERTTRLTIAGDSQCTIASIEKSGDQLAQYFCNRSSEISRNLEDLAAEVQVDPVQHVPGNLNPADIPTRATSTVSDLHPDSIWMRGPDFLQLDRDQMPLSRQFLEEHEDLIPSEELRVKKVTLLLTKVTGHDLILFKLALLVMSRTNHLGKATAVLARLIKALVSKDREKIRATLSPADLSVAKKVMFAASMD